VAEALARAGVGRLLLIDGDEVAVSNMNRQLIADVTTVGMRKVDAARARIEKIAPDCTVLTYDLFYLPENADAVPFEGLSYAADAVDTVTAKIAIIERAKAFGVPVITCMGTGNKMHPEMFRVADMEKTSVCPLARVMRRELKIRGIKGVKAVYSEEEPKKTVVPDDSTGRHAPGSIVFVPACAGLILASEAVKDLLK
jgi:tRNA A37 threonylcarbamoyladenosine dehydratase